MVIECLLLFCNKVVLKSAFNYNTLRPHLQYSILCYIAAATFSSFSLLWKKKCASQFSAPSYVTALVCSITYFLKFVQVKHFKSLVRIKLKHKRLAWNSSHTFLSLRSSVGRLVSSRAEGPKFEPTYYDIKYISCLLHGSHRS